MENHKATFSKECDCIERLIRDAASRIDRLCPVSENEKRLIVVIARKGPHLISLLKNFLKDTDYVTEFALPFIDTRNYKKFIIIDDAVYYGSTFKKITRLLLSSIADKEKNLDRRPDILAMPLVVSSNIKALLPKSMINGEVEDINQEIQKIGYKEEPFYINSVIDYIYGQQKPYDIEVPIFRLKFQGNVKLIVQQFADRIKETFNVDCPTYEVNRYNRTKDRNYIRYSLVLDSVFSSLNSLNPDFSKLRFLYDEDNEQMLISSFCTNAVERRFLDGNLPIFPESFNEYVWNPLKKIKGKQYIQEWGSVINHPLYGDFSSDEHSENLIARIELDYQYQKTLAMMANWFTGFLMFYSLSKKLSFAFPTSRYSLSLIEENLTLVLGKEKARETLNNLLKWLLSPDGVSYSLFYCGSSLSSCRGKAVDSNTYGYAFEMSLFDRLLDNRKIHSVEDAMSAEFELMHTKIELPSRHEDSDVYGRLRFGESYPSFRSRMLMMNIGGKKDKINKAVHKALDLRIDSGSAVPNFVCQRGDDDNHQWVRVFRSGENEDYRLSQLRRTFLWLFVQVLENEGQSEYLCEKSFVSWIAIAVATLEKEGVAKSGLRYLFGRETIWTGDNKKTYLAVSLDENTDPVSLIQLALDQEWIEEDPISDLYCIHRNFRREKSEYASLYPESVERMLEKAFHAAKAFYIEKKLNETISSWILTNPKILEYQLNDVRELMRGIVTDNILFLKEGEDFDFSNWDRCTKKLIAIYNYVPVPLPMDSLGNNLDIIVGEIKKKHASMVLLLNRCLYYIAIMSLINYRMDVDEDSKTLLAQCRKAVGFQILSPYHSKPIILQNKERNFLDWYIYSANLQTELDSINESDFWTMMLNLLH